MNSPKNKMDLKGLSQKEQEDLLPDNIILCGYRGSISHGTYKPSQDPSSIDDRDIMCSYIAPVNHYLGFRKKGLETHTKMVGVWDIVGHEVRKFLSQLLGCNPNVMGVLYLPEKHYLYKNELGEMIVENRDLFLCKGEVYNSYRGYAHGQLDRMKKSRENIDEVEELEKLHEQLVKQGKDPDNLSHPQTTEEERYVELAKKYYSGYMSKKRRAKVRKYGYDVKNASHLVRILGQGIELLVEGKMHLPRPNSEELVEIKEGKWSFDKVLDKSEKLFDNIEQAYMNSNLPNDKKRNEVEELLVNIIRRYHHLMGPARA